VHHHSTLRRDYTRVFGLAKNAFFVCMAVVGANLDRQRGWRQKHNLPDPWEGELTSPRASDAKATRAKRRKRTWSDLIDNKAPPPR
jgi:hypothetical protein